MEKGIDPIRLARRGEALEGQVRVVDLPRLRDIVKGDTGQVHYSLQFSLDESGVALIEGDISSRVILECQRCGQPIEYALAAHTRLKVVTTEADALWAEEGFEAFITEGQPILLSALLEEELLLALPMVARHEFGQCPADLPDYLN